MAAPSPEAKAAWHSAMDRLKAIGKVRDELVAHTEADYLAAMDAVGEAEELCGEPVAHCEACCLPIFVGDKMLGGETPLCGECAPTFETLLTEPEAFADFEGDPLTAAAALAWYERHIADGGLPTDSMAREVKD